MPGSEQHKIVFKTEGSHPAAATLYLNVYTPHERLVRALKMLGIFWGLALLSVPILVAHWVLVPGFLLAGPVAAYLRYQVTATSEKAAGECPGCHKNISVALEPKELPPLWKYCPLCNVAVHLQHAATEP